MRLAGILFWSIMALSVTVLGAQRPAGVPNKGDGLKWYPLDQATALVKSSRKKMLVYVYKDSDQLSKHMEQSSLNYPSVAEYINQAFIPVKIPADYKGNLEWNGKSYKPGRKPSDAHELVLALTLNDPSIPQVVVIDESLNVLQVFEGYRDNNGLLKILKYYGDGFYKTMPWIKYQQIEGPSKPSSESQFRKSMNKD